MPKKVSIKLTAEEVADYKRTLETFRKAWGYAVPDSLLERRAMDAVIKRRQYNANNT